MAIYKLPRSAPALQPICAEERLANAAAIAEKERQHAEVRTLSLTPEELEARDNEIDEAFQQSRWKSIHETGKLIRQLIRQHHGLPEDLDGKLTISTAKPNDWQLETAESYKHEIQTNAKPCD